jgi:hypothetical protein
VKTAFRSNIARIAPFLTSRAKKKNPPEKNFSKDKLELCHPDGMLKLFRLTQL